MFDINNQASIVEVIAAQDATSTVTGAAVDTHGLIGNLNVVQHSGAGSGNSDNTLNGKLQHSDDTTSGDFTDISGAAYTQVGHSAGSMQTIVLDRRSTKRYIRWVGTIAGTTPNFPVGVIMIAQPQSVG